MSLKESADDLFLDVVVTGDIGGSVRRQEARGQQRLLAAGLLPASIPSYGLPVNGAEVLRVWGVDLGGSLEGDPLFQRATLPAGWTLEPTEHPLWSELRDEQGRQRAGVFYKAAIYDRRAALHLCSYFSISRYEGPGGRVMFKVIDASGGERFEASDHHTAIAWLETHYPNWRDPKAYWT